MAIRLYRVFIRKDNAGMVAFFRCPLAEQIGHRRLVISQEDALFFMARRKDFIVSRAEKRAAPPMGKVFRADCGRDFVKRADCGLGNVAIKKQLHRAAFPLPLPLPRLCDCAAAS